MTQLRDVVAAIDCGTNSTRLLVVDRLGNQLARELTITRLGQGVDKTGRLDPGAITRTLEALINYKRVMDSFGVSKARLVATSAARDAANSHEFFDQVVKVTGLQVDLLDGTSEGHLSFLGATRQLEDLENQVLIVDIGGGSSEFVAGVPRQPPKFVTSLDVGCVRMTERFLRSDPPSSIEVQSAIEFIDDLVKSVHKRAKSTYSPSAFMDHRLIGLAGTVTALSSMIQGVLKYDPALTHNSVFTLEQLEAIHEELLRMKSSERSSNFNLESGRADVIVAGSLILARLMSILEFSQVTVSEADILDGIAASLLGVELVNRSACDG